jgi:hypothetical protein
MQTRTAHVARRWLMTPADSPTAEGLDSGWQTDWSLAVTSDWLFIAVFTALSRTLWSHTFYIFKFPTNSNNKRHQLVRMMLLTQGLSVAQHLTYRIQHTSCSCKVTQRSTQLTSSFQAVPLSLQFMHRRQAALDHILTAVSILSEQQNGHPTVNVPTTSNLLCTLATSSAYMMLTSSPCAAI